MSGILRYGSGVCAQMLCFCLLSRRHVFRLWYGYRLSFFFYDFEHWGILYAFLFFFSFVVSHPVLVSILTLYP